MIEYTINLMLTILKISIFPLCTIVIPVGLVAFLLYSKVTKKSYFGLRVAASIVLATADACFIYCLLTFESTSPDPAIFFMFSVVSVALAVLYFAFIPLGVFIGIAEKRRGKGWRRTILWITCGVAIQLIVYWGVWMFH